MLSSFDSNLTVIEAFNDGIIYKDGYDPYKSQTSQILSGNSSND